MQVLLKVLIITKLFFCVVTSIVAQDYIAPISSYSFNNNSIVDDKGYSELSLFNQANLYNDNERGNVLRFSAASKGYATINKNLLNTDSCTISFFLYWESSDATSWHQLFEIFDPATNSSLFFTPQNGWGSNMCSVISDNKEYSLYEAVNASTLERDTWIHLAICFKGKQVIIYKNGAILSSGYLTLGSSSISANSIYFGGNPDRTNNYYISARLDEIKVFNQALSQNQVQALANEISIPEAENNTTVWDYDGNSVQIEIDFNDKKQTIQNFGASDGWNTERIGKFWPTDKKEKLAELLFSDEKDIEGNPKGIGLSAWRFNIGAGTTEQGDASRISKEERRTEGFLNPDGKTYNWNKQIGQQWFLKKAAIDYNINHIIGWQNSPPVAFTNSNLGFRDYGQPLETILKSYHYNNYGSFLVDVIKHFKEEGIVFDYISPLNEPQHGWAPSQPNGTVSQEGTPWTNQNIYDVVTAIDNQFVLNNIDTKLFISEAASIKYMYGGSGHAANQLYNFWNPGSSLYLANKTSMANVVSYHSYFLDYGYDLINVRKTLSDNMQSLSQIPQAWQTEYSLLSNGYRDGYPAEYKLTEMETALSLAKVIMSDLNVANTSAWQWWTTFEKGKFGGESRYCLIEVATKNDNSDGTYHPNKLFYTFGNFSHFIRPGMVRVGVSRSDNLSSYMQISDVMYSAYVNKSKFVLVAANFSDKAKKTDIIINGNTEIKLENKKLFLTDEFNSLAIQDVDLSAESIIVPAYSVITYSADILGDNAISSHVEESDFKVFYDVANSKIKVLLDSGFDYEEIRLYHLSGDLVECSKVDRGTNELEYSTSNLTQGIYLISGVVGNSQSTKKVVVY